MVEIELHNIEKKFIKDDKEKQILHKISASIAMGEIVAIRGDNGSGKTTLLNIISGIETNTGGTINFGNLDREKVRVGYAQQDYTSSLLPWFDTLENVAIPLRIRGVPYLERRQRAEQTLYSLGFDNLPKTAYPYQLSGGQKQKIAVARAIIHEPHLLLLDEPFANLDAHTSRDLQEILLYIHETRHPTILYVSHELDHCIYLADRILLLHGSPASIVFDFKISLQRPRMREVILSPAYTEIRSHIIAMEEKLYAKKESNI